jgi:hypothetical protein
MLRSVTCILKAKLTAMFNIMYREGRIWRNQLEGQCSTLGKQQERPEK